MGARASATMALAHVHHGLLVFRASHYGAQITAAIWAANVHVMSLMRVLIVRRPSVFFSAACVGSACTASATATRDTRARDVRSLHAPTMATMSMASAFATKNGLALIVRV